MLMKQGRVGIGYVWPPSRCLSVPEMCKAWSQTQGEAAASNTKIRSAVKARMVHWEINVCSHLHYPQCLGRWKCEGDCFNYPWTPSLAFIGCGLTWHRTMNRCGQNQGRNSPDCRELEAGPGPPSYLSGTRPSKNG